MQWIYSLFKLILVITFFLVSPLSYSDKELIGQTYYLNSPKYWYLIRLSGACLSRDPRDNSCPYVINAVFNKLRMVPYLMVLKNIGSSKESDKKSYLITDILEHPRVPKGYETTFECFFDNNRIFGIIAIARANEESVELTKDISWANRLDFSSGKFLPIDKNTLKCAAGYEG